MRLPADACHPEKLRRGCRPALPGIVLSLLLACLPAIASPADTPANILFVTSHTSTPYLHFIEATRQAFLDDSLPRPETTEVSASQLIKQHDATDETAFDMVIALGTQAAQALQYRRAQTPALYALIPQTTYKHLRESGRLACPGQLCTAVYIDQPLPRLLDILSAAFGKRQRPGVLLGPTSAQHDKTLENLAGQRGLELQTARIDDQDELLPALDELLKHTDVLLSLPDPLVYNRHTAKSVLLTTYRYRVPVLAYSRAYADAGAALSVYSTPAQIARQAAGIAVDFLKNGKNRLPPPQYPEHFRIRINRHVSDSLGLDLAGNTQLRSLTSDADDEQAEYKD
jgi:ABC-type uncharacterized transport system substrate-binding protein